MKSAIERLARAGSVLSWRHWAWVTGLAVVAGIVMPFQYFDVNPDWVLQRILLHMPWYVAFGYLFLLAFAWVESGTGSAPTVWRYASAALAAGVLCVGISASLAPLLPRPERLMVDRQPAVLPRGIDPDVRRRWSAAFSPGLDSALYGLLSVLIYVRLRNSRRMASRLSEAELARSEANRVLLESRLAAAHAQVDPRRVIERLEAIALLYEADPNAAEAQLDEFVADLRRAIPRIRAEAVHPAPFDPAAPDPSAGSPDSSCFSGPRRKSLSSERAFP